MTTNFISNYVNKENLVLLTCAISVTCVSILTYKAFNLQSNCIKPENVKNISDDFPLESYLKAVKAKKSQQHLESDSTSLLEKTLSEGNTLPSDQVEAYAEIHRFGLDAIKLVVDFSSNTGVAGG